MAQVEEQDCPNMECEHRKDENGMLYEVQHEDQDQIINEGDNVNEQDVRNI